MAANQIQFLTIEAVKNRITVPNYVKIGQTVAEISWLVIFKMAAAAILDFHKFEILAVGRLKGAKMRHHAEFRQNRSNRCRDMAI